MKTNRNSVLDETYKFPDLSHLSHGLKGDWYALGDFMGLIYPSWQLISSERTTQTKWKVELLLKAHKATKNG
jgi:hypothetical protein